MQGRLPRFVCEKGGARWLLAAQRPGRLHVGRIIHKSEAGPKKKVKFREVASHVTRLTHSRLAALGTAAGATQEEEEERSLIKDLKRYAQLAVAWDRHGSLVPRWT